MTERSSSDSASIYIASKTRHASKWIVWRAAGANIISTWVDEAGEGESTDLHDLWDRCISESRSCRVLIVYREPEDVLKGAWVEIGAALAVGTPVYAVGLDGFTISNYRGITHFPTIETAFSAAAALRATQPAAPAGGESLREALELAKNIIFGSQFAATRERNYAKAAEYQSYIDTIDAALATPSPIAQSSEVEKARVPKLLCSCNAEGRGWHATWCRAYHQHGDVAQPSPQHDHRVYFGCECCEEHAPDNGVNCREDIGVMPDGTWLCDGCYSDCDKSAYGMVASDIDDFEFPRFEDLPRPAPYGASSLPSTEGK